MSSGAVFALGVGLLLAAWWAARVGLEQLNRRHALAHAGAAPEEFRHVMDAATYARSVQYTLAQGRFEQVAATVDAVARLGALFSPALPWGYRAWTAGLGESAWSVGAFLLAAGGALSLFGLPLDWYHQFRLEQRFGFNTTTPRLWWADRARGLLLAAALGYPLVVLVLGLMAWAGAGWWGWAWGAWLGFQVLLQGLAPVLILPLFNRFTPLPAGPLRERLLRLAARTRFRARAIQVMDGSKRSRHSNAFFTGFGRFRKIVLYDTLVEQLTAPELEAVLAHEIGHYRMRHLPKLLLGSAAGALAGFWLLAWLAGRAWFYEGFGFAPGHPGPALLLFGLLAGVAGFWLAPLWRGWSRRCEYQADAFAAAAVGGPEPLLGALRQLAEKNLSNLTPHPCYRRFYYSHPTLRERERALAARGAPAAAGFGL